MPIYEYTCDKCGNFFEELVAGGRAERVPCPACGFAETQKRVSAIGGISVKGGTAACPSAGAFTGGGCPGMSACGGGCPKL